MDTQSAFTILELSPDTNIDAVNKTFRKMIADWHPDKFHNDKRRKAFAEGFSKDLILARACLNAYLSGSHSHGQVILTLDDDNLIRKQINLFVTDVFLKAPSDGIAFADLYYIYNLWCSEKNVTPISLFQLKTRLEDFEIIPIQEEANPFFLFIRRMRYKLNQKWQTEIDICEDMRDIINEPEESISEMDDDDDLGEVVY